MKRHLVQIHAPVKKKLDRVCKQRRQTRSVVVDVALDALASIVPVNIPPATRERVAVTVQADAGEASAEADASA